MIAISANQGRGQQWERFTPSSVRCQNGNAGCDEGDALDVKARSARVALPACGAGLDAATAATGAVGGCQAAAALAESSYLRCAASTCVMWVSAHATTAWIGSTSVRPSGVSEYSTRVPRGGSCASGARRVR